MKSTKKCRQCHGVLQARKVEHPYWNGTTLVAVVKEVPSWVCENCGYHHFDPVVETTLRFIVKDYERMGTLFPIPSTPYRKITE